MVTIEDDYYTLKNFYNNSLNLDKSLVKTSNDEPTPIECVEEMLSKIPTTVLENPNLKWLDPCCGCGNFFVVAYHLLSRYHTREHILSNMLYFNDINEERLEVVKKVFGEKSTLNISNIDFIADADALLTYDVIVANPPYAKLLPDGKRASKNHNLISAFLDTSFKHLNPGGFVVFITPDNWMSLADRNHLIKKITSKQIIHLDIHTAKKYFKKIGSSFTWYVIENTVSYKDMCVSGTFKKHHYTDTVKSEIRSYIPLFYTSTIQSILSKTLDNPNIEKFPVETSSNLHKYTKKKLISKTQCSTFKYKLIHTPSQIVWANTPHIYQDGFKVFLGTTSYYKVFVDACGMTQSIAFIRCPDEATAHSYACVLNHPLYVFLNNICRWGNFNNVRILQSFPLCLCYDDVYKTFQITDEEIEFMKTFL